MTSVAQRNWPEFAAAFSGDDSARPMGQASHGRSDRAGMDAISQLTEGQRDCLRLVYQHMTSKDIARALGVSPHTVDMRLRTAMRTLSVASRIEAARLLVEAEGGAGAYQPLIYQAPELAGGDDGATVGAPASTRSDENAIPIHSVRIRPVVGPPAGGPPRPAGASPLYNPEWSPLDQRPIGHSAPLAGSLPWGSRNELSVAARLAWIAMIAIGSALGFGAILGAFEALKHIV